MNTNFIEHKYKFKKFSKEQRSSFKYWYYHWKAFNLTAFHLGHWRFKYLFHDIEKPWLMLFWKDYNRVQKWHRTHNNHHVEYNGIWDPYAMIIDWECSRFTKIDAPMDAWQTLKQMLNESKDKKFRQKLYVNIAYTLLDLKLTSIFGVNILHDNMLYDYIDTPNVEHN
jgi:hypothetical protein